MRTHQTPLPEQRKNWFLPPSAICIFEQTIFWYSTLYNGHFSNSSVHHNRCPSNRLHVQVYEFHTPTCIADCIYESIVIARFILWQSKNKSSIKIPPNGTIKREWIIFKMKFTKLQLQTDLYEQSEHFKQKCQSCSPSRTFKWLDETNSSEFGIHKEFSTNFCEYLIGKSMISPHHVQINGSHKPTVPFSCSILIERISRKGCQYESYGWFGQWFSWFACENSHSRGEMAFKIIETEVSSAVWDSKTNVWNCWRSCL